MYAGKIPKMGKYGDNMAHMPPQVPHGHQRRGGRPIKAAPPCPRRLPRPQSVGEGLECMHTVKQCRFHPRVDNRCAMDSWTHMSCSKSQQPPLEPPTSTQPTSQPPLRRINGRWIATVDPRGRLPLLWRPLTSTTTIST